MAVTLVSSQRIDANVWRLEWASDLPSPTFYVYVNGVLTSITMATSQLITVQPGSYVVFEVFDDPDDPPAEQWPDSIVLTWAAVPGAAQYRIDQYIAGAWAEISRVYPNPQGDCRFQSPIMGDCQAHRFRCVAIGANGRESAGREWTVLMVRRPDVPRLTYAYYSATGVATIDA